VTKGAETMDLRCGKWGEYYPGTYNNGPRVGPWWLSYHIDRFAARSLARVPLFGLRLFGTLHHMLYRIEWRECRHGSLVP
jgi:hypothetical protein